jgi:hypothetical protein
MKNSLIALSFCALAFAVRADEGMWLYNQPPRQLLRERHKFEAPMRDTPVQILRPPTRRVGSFVSEDGLLISNHHVGRTRCRNQHKGEELSP